MLSAKDAERIQGLGGRHLPSSCVELSGCAVFSLPLPWASGQQRRVLAGPPGHIVLLRGELILVAVQGLPHQNLSLTPASSGQLLFLFSFGPSGTLEAEWAIFTP